jgi:hypothetical protein
LPACVCLAAKNPGSTLRITHIGVPEELRPANWLDHALLGDSAVTAISGLYETASMYQEFYEEMKGKPADTHSQFGQPTGPEDDEEEPGINTFRRMNQYLQDAAKKLLSVLSHTPTLSPQTKTSRKA